MIFNIKTLATINLVLQVLILGTVLVAAYQAKIRRKLIIHCRFVRVAMVVQIITVVFIMLPWMLGYLKAPGTTLRTEMLVHHSLGILLILLWGYINLAVAGRVRVLGKLAMYMRAALFIWGLVFLLGLYLYLRIYVMG